MRKLSVAATILFGIGLLGTNPAYAQSMDDMNLQVHGYVTQGFVYSTKNNWDTTNSSDGSAAWSDAVVNVSARPEPRLRVAVQARYYLLGSYGNQITLDFASADFSVNDKLGFRVGKVKTPTSLLNETQDVDPANLWILLPQSLYPVASRDSTLSHYGGVVYGTVALGESLGKVEYRAFGGQRVVGPKDGFLQPFYDAGFTLPDGLTAPTYGGRVVWDTPLPGLIAGAGVTSQKPSGRILMGPYQGTVHIPWFDSPYFFAKYERGRYMLGGEYSPYAVQANILLPGIPAINSPTDRRTFYGMASYKLSQKLTGGLYYSSMVDYKSALPNNRYQKDWALSARYDFNSYLYGKCEEHFVDGMGIGYSTSNNTGGLQPNTRMTLLKLGVSF